MSKSDLKISKFFSKEGPLAQIPGYKIRQAQVELAQAIEHCIQKKSILLAEAGTGTGKTWAYLIPTFLSQQKAIISTGTRTLQDQLFYKDVPLVREKTGLPIQVSTLKGRSNYVCLLHLEKLEEQEVPFHSKEEIVYFQDIKRFSNRTKTGDKADCIEVPENHSVWSKVTATRDQCLGRECPHIKDCFVYKARAQAQDADVVIVNHALLMSDFRLRQSGQGDLLPGADVIIFDEAHQIPDYATRFLGDAFNTWQLKDWLADCKALVRSKIKSQSEFLIQRCDAIQSHLQELFLSVQEIKESKDNRLILDKMRRKEAFLTDLTGLLNELRRLVVALQQYQDISEDIEVLARQGASLYESFNLWIENDRVSDAVLEKKQAQKKSQTATEAKQEEIASEDEAEEIIQELLKETQELTQVDETTAQSEETQQTEQEASLNTANLNVNNIESTKEQAEAEDEPSTEVIDTQQSQYVRWLELSDRVKDPVLRFFRAPLSVKHFVQFKQKEQAWVFTSATLATVKRVKVQEQGRLKTKIQKDFSHFYHRLGLYDAETESWESPFDYQKNALLYVPTLPEIGPVQAPTFNQHFVHQLMPLIQASPGGVLILCTSLRAVDQISELLELELKRLNLERLLLKQGDHTRTFLNEKFRQNKQAILIGSSSFWEGVDFSGDALTLVAIDKLPFMPPDDPVLEARINECTERQGSPFHELQIPHAAISLKQGAGRLLRSEQDRGVLMIADARLVDKNYGSLLWRSLPPFKRSRNLDESLSFFKALFN